jgi:hypothetical protein
MKIPAIKYSEYPSQPQTTKPKGFAGNFAVSKTPFTDKILKKPFAQKLFSLASENPHVFNLINIGILGTLIRPATLIIIPGAEKEDKQYVAAKSVIGTVLLVASELAICIPLAKCIDKLGEAAKKNPASKFPKIGTPKFKAYGYLVNNVVGLALTLASSAFITVKLTTKIMNKLDKNKKENNKK